jgi:hypothetical protein
MFYPTPPLHENPPNVSPMNSTMVGRGVRSPMVGSNYRSTKRVVRWAAADVADVAEAVGWGVASERGRNIIMPLATRHLPSTQRHGHFRAAAGRWRYVRRGGGGREKYAAVGRRECVMNRVTEGRKEKIGYRRLVVFIHGVFTRFVPPFVRPFERTFVLPFVIDDDPVKMARRGHSLGRVHCHLYDGDGQSRPNESH